MTQSLEESQLDCLALKLRQRTDVFLQKMAKIIQNQHLRCIATRSLRVLRYSLLIALSRTRISLPAAQPVDRATAGDGNHPSERLAGLGRITTCLFPDLKKNFL